MAATETKRVIVEMKIKVDKAIKQAAASFKKMSIQVQRASKQIRNMNSVMSNFRNIMSGIAAFSIAGLGVSGLTRIADDIQLLTDRISIFEGEGGDAAATMRNLGAAANLTKTSITGLAEVYNRLALAMSDAGVKGEALLGLTVGLQQTFRL